MKFSDNIERTNLEEVFVIRKSEEMEAREEYNSNLWDLERRNFLKKGNNIYSIPASKNKRILKIR